MEYVIGPVIALLIGMKFTAYKTKPTPPAISHEELATRISDVDIKVIKLEKELVEHNKSVSQQTLSMMLPMAKSVQAINSQLGL